MNNYDDIINYLLAHESEGGEVEVIDNLTSADTDKPLSANQGRVLNEAKVDTNDSRLSDARTPTAHTHDDRYYTESEIDTKLSGKSDTGHTHDDRYFTETEVTTKLGTKSNVLSVQTTTSASTSVGANSNVTVSANITKSGYTPLGIVGYKSTSASALNVYALFFKWFDSIRKC